MGYDEPARVPFTSDRVEKSALNLYLQTIAGSILGYVYWIIASRLLDSEAIGILSTALAISVMLVNLAGLGIPLGIQRLLGKSLSENDIKSFSQYFRIGFVIITAGFAAISIGTIIVWLLFGSLLFSEQLIILSLILLPQAFLNIMRAPFIAMQRTKPILLVTIAAHGGKLAIGIALMLLGLGVYGAVAGYFIFFVGSAVGLGIILARILPINIRGGYIKTLVRPAVSSGMPSWLPGTIASIGSQLGVVVVFGLHGASEAGFYFIAFSIMNFILAIPQSLIGALFPALSGKIQNPEYATSRILIMSVAISLPIIAFISIFSADVLTIFGEEYRSASLILIILAFSVVPYAIHAAIDAYFYAKGNYRTATMMGIVSEIPKVALYIVLVPLFSAEGAAYSYVIGVVIGAIASIAVAVYNRIKLNWYVLIILLATTGALSYSLYISQIPWYAGMAILFTVLPITYTRLKLITRNELSEFLDAFPISSKVRTEKTKWISKVLFG